MNGNYWLDKIEEDELASEFVADMRTQYGDEVADDYAEKFASGQLTISEWKQMIYVCAMSEYIHRSVSTLRRIDNSG